MPNDNATTGNKLDWIPILTELGEDIVARVIDRSPDIKAALLEAKANFNSAVDEGEALRKKGHVVDAAGNPPDAPDPGDVDNPGRTGGG